MHQIQFHCIACGAGLSAAAAETGGVCTCTQCQRLTPVPAAEWRFPAILGIEIKFGAACCGAKIQVDAESQGMAFDCPKCHASSRVPFWGGRPAAGAPAPVRKTVPPMRLSAEECTFLSAPLRRREPALSAAGNR